MGLFVPEMGSQGNYAIRSEGGGNGEVLVAAQTS
jgi:hypothetical protein